MKKVKMTATEFVYWLQGLFELQEDIATLNQKQVSAILSKLSAVEAGKTDVELESKSFIDFISGMLHLANNSGDAQLLTKTTTTIKSKLHDLFVHAIDPALPGDQKEHHKRHTADRPGIVAMC